MKSKKQTNEKVISLKEKEEIKELTSNKLSKNNTIIGTYSIKSGEKFQLFNPEKLNLTGDDYYIESLDKNNSLRNLRAINDDKGYYIPEETGEKSFKIVFKIILKNLSTYRFASFPFRTHAKWEFPFRIFPFRQEIFIMKIRKY